MKRCSENVLRMDLNIQHHVIDKYLGANLKLLAYLKRA